MSDTAVDTIAQASGARERPLAERLLQGLLDRLVIIVPYVWLLVFFLVPFVIVFKISLSQTAIAMPPYIPTFDLTAGWQALSEGLSELSWDNYTWLTEDPLYYTAYVSSLVIAGVSTLLALLVGY